MPQHGRRGPARRRPLRVLSVILFGLTALAFASTWHPSADGQTGTAQPPAQPPQAGASPLDQPLAMILEARKSYAAVKDYTCTLLSQENIRGVLQEQNVMQFKMRTQPFSVYMRWLAPKKSQGQEVCFVLGKNDNKMRVHSTALGQGKLLGFVSVAPNDPRVMEHSRHTIYEAGMGNLIEETVKHWDLERKAGKSKVQVAEYKYDNRRCFRIENVRTERVQGFYCYRSVIYLEADTKLPIRNENYDWPRAGGPADGELLEMFSYTDLRLNAGLTEQDFNK
jgi:hypothetical protein